MVKREQNIKYKKAPQAPRRFKSAYMFFSTDKHRQIRKELGEKLQTTEVAKMVSQAWKDLSPEEREQWDEMARRDKARYEVEKTMYTGPWKVPAKKRTQKDPSAPKRPMSAFLSFSNSRRAMVKAQNPNIGNAEVSRILAKMWKGAPENERKEHIDREYELRKEYKSAIAEWRKTADQELDDLRKKREAMAMRTVDARGGQVPDGVGMGPAVGSMDSPAGVVGPSGYGGGPPAVGPVEGMEQHQYHPHPGHDGGQHHYHHHNQQLHQHPESGVEMDKRHPPAAGHTTVMSAAAAAAARGMPFPQPPYPPTSAPYGAADASAAAASYPQHYGSYGVAPPAPAYDETASGGAMASDPSYNMPPSGPYPSSQDPYGMQSGYSQGYGAPPPDSYADTGYDSNMQASYYGGYYHHGHQEAMPPPWTTTGPGGYYSGATRSPVGATATAPAGAAGGPPQASYGYGSY